MSFYGKGSNGGAGNKESKGGKCGYTYKGNKSYGLQCKYNTGNGKCKDPDCKYGHSLITEQSSKQEEVKQVSKAQAQAQAQPQAREQKKNVPLEYRCAGPSNYK